MTLLDRIRDMPPHWAGETIRPFDEDLFRDSRPFVRRHYWCDSGSVNVFRIIGTIHASYPNEADLRCARIPRGTIPTTKPRRDSHGDKPFPGTNENRIPDPAIGRVRRWGRRKVLRSMRESLVAKSAYKRIFAPKIIGRPTTVFFPERKECFCEETPPPSQRCQETSRLSHPRF